MEIIVETSLKGAELKPVMERGVEDNQVVGEPINTEDKKEIEELKIEEEKAARIKNTEEKMDQMKVETQRDKQKEKEEELTKNEEQLTKNEEETKKEKKEKSGAEKVAKKEIRKKKESKIVVKTLSEEAKIEAIVESEVKSEPEIEANISEADEAKEEVKLTTLETEVKKSEVEKELNEVEVIEAEKLEDKAEVLLDPSKEEQTSHNAGSGGETILDSKEPKIDEIDAKLQEEKPMEEIIEPKQKEVEVEATEEKVGLNSEPLPNKKLVVEKDDTISGQKTEPDTEKEVDQPPKKNLEDEVIPDEIKPKVKGGEGAKRKITKKEFIVKKVEEKPEEEIKPIIPSKSTDVNNTDDKEDLPTEVPEPNQTNMNQNGILSQDIITEAVSDSISQEQIAKTSSYTEPGANEHVDSKADETVPALCRAEKETSCQESINGEESNLDKSTQLDVDIKHPGTLVVPNANDENVSSQKDESKTDKKKKSLDTDSKSSKKKSTSIDKIKESNVEAADASIEPKMENNILHELANEEMKEEEQLQNLVKTKENQEMVQTVQAGLEESATEKNIDLKPSSEEIKAVEAASTMVVENDTVGNLPSEDSKNIDTEIKSKAVEANLTAENKTEAHEETKATKTKGKDLKSKETKKKGVKSEAKADTLEVPHESTVLEAYTMEKTMMEATGLEKTKASEENKNNLSLVTGAENLSDPDFDNSIAELSKNYNGNKVQLDDSPQFDIGIKPAGAFDTNENKLDINSMEDPQNEKVEVRSMDVTNEDQVNQSQEAPSEDTKYKPLAVPKEELINKSLELKEEEQESNLKVNKEEKADKTLEAPNEEKAENKTTEVRTEEKVDSLEEKEKESQPLIEPIINIEDHPKVTTKPIDKKKLIKSKTSVVKKPHKSEPKAENQQEITVTETRHEDKTKEEPKIENLKEPANDDRKESIIEDLKEPIEKVAVEEDIAKETRIQSESSPIAFTSLATSNPLSESMIEAPRLEPAPQQLKTNKFPEPPREAEQLIKNGSVLDWKFEDEEFSRELKSCERAEELGNVQIKTIEELISSITVTAREFLGPSRNRRSVKEVVREAHSRFAQ